MHDRRLRERISSGVAGTIKKESSLIRVRIVNLLGPTPVSRVLRVAGRLGTVLRDRPERATCRVSDSILRATSDECSSWKVDGRGGSSTKCATRLSTETRAPAMDDRGHFLSMSPVRSWLIDPAIHPGALLRSLPLWQTTINPLGPGQSRSTASKSRPSSPPRDNVALRFGHAVIISDSSSSRNSEN